MLDAFVPIRCQSGIFFGKSEFEKQPFRRPVFQHTLFNAGNISVMLPVDGPTMLRIRCILNFLLKTPEHLKRTPIYWPHRHLPCATISWGGMVGCFHPIRVDIFRATTSLTLLKRLRADAAETSLNNADEYKAIGKLNFRFDSSDCDDSPSTVSNVLSIGTIWSYSQHKQ